MIATAAPALAPAEAARRASAGGRGFWLSSPASPPLRRARDLVGALPVGLIEGTTLADLDRLEEAWRRARVAWGAGGPPPPGVPVAVGWLSYELGRRLVGLPPDPRAAGQPLFSFQFFDAVWTCSADTEPAAAILAQDGAAARRLTAALARPLPPPRPPRLGALQAVDPELRFLAAVRRILAYELAGDTYQVNLSRRLSADWHEGEPVSLAAALRASAPAPQAAFIAEGPGRAIVGNSPERFLSLSCDGVVETCPIKGTRPRAAMSAVDAEVVTELCASPKDRAEHVMIVDLERNDLGRVCRVGSVEVTALARVVSLATVHHLESTVRGTLRPGVGLAGLLAATFPGGSITGAPKRRAMEIIDELEPRPRGLYTGATGWLGAAGDLDLAIAIRTGTLADGRLELSVGGGVVIESTPEGELAETAVKARAFAALAGAAPPA
ncbi:MAG TPA: anthranilate synthase component I family protein [Polyangia bacterium]|nr:anthranilate synthase component I family protein [Polyangia bacterium]